MNDPNDSAVVIGFMVAGFSGAIMGFLFGWLLWG